METITAAEFARNAKEILKRIREEGESFRVEQDGEVIAEIAPPREPANRFTVADFVEVMRTAPPSDDKLADDLEEIHALQGALPPSPWEC
jgi:antitoxin (DNA-binding transcriptional repressor) of toxin-antitoxin stability system